MIGLFCRISSLLQGSFAKETYHFKAPTNRSHPIQQTPIVCNSLHLTATRLIILQHATQCTHYTATHYISLQHTLSYCNTQHNVLATLQLTTSHCNTPDRTATQCAYQTAIHYISLQHTLSYCNTMYSLYLLLYLLHLTATRTAIQCTHYIFPRQIHIAHYIFPRQIVRIRSYGVATVSRLLQIIGLFCKRAL